MRRVIPALLLTVAGLIPLWRFEATPHESTAVLADPGGADPGAAGSGTPPPGATTTPGGSGQSTTSATGSTEATNYGSVQVQVTFTGDRITEVRTLRAPTSTRTQGALPRLRQSALTAQSADIDTVSGATQTSQAYARSLRAAIDAKGR
ncbi:FMN-binding protein [Crossiella sp. CA-258035]|uniref:FMN-binding protein n=1 Tax=Crossiella sp. CA-258035 TaxID=2981138 RepID=UPI0024BCDE29|nr:FMN-binding protein [Crossiella sp. CA-258035]WHT20811.1 FMN-binding protein [Crossiella sp. CA-258035]